MLEETLKLSAEQAQFEQELKDAVHLAREKHRNLKKLSFLVRSGKAADHTVIQLAKASGLEFEEGNKAQIKRCALILLKDRREGAKIDERAAIEEYAGDTQLFSFSERVAETRALAKRLREYAWTGTGDVHVGKSRRRVFKGHFAARTASQLEGCSTLLLRKESIDGSFRKVAYQNRCKNGVCGICSHCRQMKITESLLQQIVEKMKTEKSGSLLSFVLTYRNTSLENATKGIDAWSEIMRRKGHVFKTKDNPHAVWNLLPWGWSKFEITKNQETGLYHGHLHLLAFASSYLGKDEDKNSAWARMQRDWSETCAKFGLEAAINGSEAVNGGIVQHRQLVVNVADLKENSENEIRDELRSAASEMAKYVAKSAQEEKLGGVEGLLNVMAALYRRKVMNAWGDVKVHMDSKPDVVEPDVPMFEVVYRFGGGQFSESLRVEWDDEIHEALWRDLKDWRIRRQVIDGYEAWRTAKSGEAITALDTA